MTQEKYKSLLKEKQTAWETFYTTQQEMQAEYVAALAADYKKAFPKRKPYTPAKFADVPNRVAILAERQPKAKALGETYRTKEKEIEAALNALAASDLQVWTTPEKIGYYSCSVSSYHTQGYGANRYAKEDAESKTEQAKLAGLEAETRYIANEYPSYQVFANTDDAGWDFAMRKPVQSLKDWIKSCWKRGVNPRVYNPFLPTGLEEKLGLDYFGGEKELIKK